MADVIPFKSQRPLYEARSFSTVVEGGTTFLASGTLCGHIDFATPRGTYVLSPDEVLSLIAMLQGARSDVLEHSDPLGDPRIVERK